MFNNIYLKIYSSTLQCIFEFFLMTLVGHLPQKWLIQIKIALCNTILIGGWQINNAITHQRKVGTNRFWAKVLWFLLQHKKKGWRGQEEGTKSKTQGFCSFFSKNYHLKGMMQYHLPIQLQHKLEHLQCFSGKNHYYNFDLPLGLFHCVIFFKKSQSRSRALRIYHIWDQSILLSQTRTCLKKVATYLWFTYFAIPEEN